MTNLISLWFNYWRCGHGKVKRYRLAPPPFWHVSPGNWTGLSSRFTALAVLFAPSLTFTLLVTLLTLTERRKKAKQPTPVLALQTRREWERESGLGVGEKRGENTRQRSAQRSATQLCRSRCVVYMCQRAARYKGARRREARSEEKEKKSGEKAWVLNAGDQGLGSRWQSRRLSSPVQHLPSHLAVFTDGACVPEVASPACPMMAQANEWILQSASFFWIFTLLLSESQSKKTQTCEYRSVLLIPIRNPPVFDNFHTENALCTQNSLRRLLLADDSTVNTCACVGGVIARFFADSVTG